MHLKKNLWQRKKWDRMEDNLRISGWSAAFRRDQRRPRSGGKWARKDVATVNYDRIAILERKLSKERQKGENEVADKKSQQTDERLINREEEVLSTRGGDCQKTRSRSSPVGPGGPP